MGMNANSIWECRQNASDSNGGGFNPANVNMDATLTATSGNTASPVVSTANYTFVAGDVGCWIFIKSGTNWIPGWYQIASVSAGAATLTASVGSASLFDSNSRLPVSLNTAAGCATTASPTVGTWTMDYSIVDTSPHAAITVTLASTTTFTAVGHVGPNVVGNIVNVAAGGSATAGLYEIVSQSAGTATIDRSWTASSGSSTATIGGALASPGLAAAQIPGSHNTIFIKYNATSYSMSASTNVAGGSISWGSGGGNTGAPVSIVGYNTTRTMWNADANRPTLIPSANSVTLIHTNVYVFVNNIIFANPNAKTTCIGLQFGNTKNLAFNCKADSLNYGFYANAAWGQFVQCEASNFTTAGFYGSGSSGVLCLFCVAHGGGSSSAGFSLVHYCIFCLAYGGNGQGFSLNDQGVHAFCTAHGVAGTTGSNGIGFSLNTGPLLFLDCVATGNGQWGFQQANLGDFQRYINPVTQGNTTAAFGTGVLPNYNVVGAIAAGSSPYVNAGAGNFAPATGSPLKAASFPTSLPPGTTPIANDIGAAQSAASGGGGGVIATYRRKVR